MAKFEAGKTYTCRSACDHDTVFSWDVLSRTAKTMRIWSKLDGDRRVKIQDAGADEWCYPSGRYSMCPVIRADKPEAPTPAPAPEDERDHDLEAFLDDARSTSEEHDETFGRVIFAYTRAQAIADGVLVDPGKMAREAGFTVNVAITAAAWSDCVAWTAEDSRRQVYQDEAGRLWDLLYMAGLAARKAARRNDRTETLYQFYRVMRGGRARTASKVTLKICSGPGDSGEHVITIMQPHED